MQLVSYMPVGPRASPCMQIALNNIVKYGGYIYGGYIEGGYKTRYMYCERIFFSTIYPKLSSGRANLGSGEIMRCSQNT